MEDVCWIKLNKILQYEAVFAKAGRVSINHCKHTANYKLAGEYETSFYGFLEIIYERTRLKFKPDENQG